ncbi:Proline/betaine transporter [Aquicella siphonis]|uniref:Proline/betaine transporter n=1 Tax=Aquicella siphonis TaxID=254247 RepID=A0A5E4PG49_9COXI|nr:MFS transporter [Aquicella siphonis]VVC75488.1 Proline/betaine transporter [Aquicella siphonis]
MRPDQRKLIFLSSLGGVLEFYDFIIYALFAGYIANAFFPAANALMGLIVTFATFAIGYLVRPLGGVIFGHYGDRIGRKTTFTFSIFMMALATLGIGLIPDYAAIGIAAPILVILLRLLQGFSIGGEIPGAIAYVSESLPEKKGYACGVIFCALTMGIVLGSLVQACVINVFNDVQMQSYGWRIPFVAGGVFGLISYFMRRELRESSQFLQIEKEVEAFPLGAVCREQLAVVVAGIFIIASCAAIVTSLFLFIPAYFSKVLDLPATAYIWQRTAAIAFGSVLCIPFGWLSDKVNLKKLLLTLNLATCLMAFPIYYIYAHFPAWFSAAFIASAVLTGFSAGIVPVVISELFPTRIRYSGIAMSYNLGFAIFGGLTPFFSLSLVYYTGSVISPALYVFSVAFLALMASIWISRRTSSISRLQADQSSSQVLEC